MKKSHAIALGVSFLGACAAIYVANNNLPILGSSVRSVLN